MNIIEQPLDLANIVENEVVNISSLHFCGLLLLGLNLLLMFFCVQVKPSTPVLMCSVPGYDASGLVRDLAAEQNKQITSISIGKEQISSYS